MSVLSRNELLHKYEKEIREIDEISFHFENDIWRVGQIRNIGVIEGQELFSDNGWEKVRQKKEADIKAWIS